MTWRRCYTAPIEPEAHMVKGFLAERGIPSILRPLGPSVYPGAFGVEVLVPIEWERVARRLIARRRRPTRGVVRLDERRRRA
jgi:putative signal transducing protein